MMRGDGMAPAGAEVRLEGVSRSYGGQPVVDGIDLVAGSGEILALLGPSGCGKTTTLRMIAGLVEPSGGDIRIGGRSVLGVPVHKRDLGMLFQNYALFPHLTVLDNVAFGLGMRGMARAEAAARAREALQLVRLGGFEDRMPAGLSGGQQQRVALARAIVYRPRALLLDEPFGALDKKLREAMQVELRQLCSALGLTAIIVTHDQEEALVLADKVAVMRGGRIEQVGSAREVYERPASRCVAEFIGASNLFGAVAGRRDGPATTLETDAGLVLRTSLPNDLAAGERVMVVVRSECAALSPGTREPADGDPATLPNRVSGPVLRLAYKGQNLSVWIGLPGGGEMLCTVPADMAPGPAAGETWTASWPPERTLAVREH